jgi:peptide/nickel transport system substrate-binding protein
MQRIYAEQLPVLPLYYRADDHVVPNWLKGFTATGSSVTSLWAEAWHPG